ncbi:MAG: TVP38/TMEM64 family protein [Thermoanaerobaculia bacterium]|nr:TVP38/TMEM64 family protein [Thermoanaerobaculia bacterium]
MSRRNTQPTGSRAQLALRLLLLVGLLGVGVVLLKFTPVGELFQRDRIIALLESLRHEPWMPFALIGAYAVSTPIGLPASPLVLGGGMVFGPLVGALYNMLGLVTGAMVSYWVGRALGREAVLQLAGPKLRRAEMVFNRRGFWPLVQSRFLPIPFPLVSYAAALAGVGWWRFFLTTVLGVVPSTFVHTYFAPQLILAGLEGRDMKMLGVGYVLAVLLLNVIAVWPQVQERLRRRRRYRELIQRRAERTRDC